MTYRLALASDFEGVLNLACQLANHIGAERPLLTARQFEVFYLRSGAPMHLLLAIESDKVVGMIAWTLTCELYSADTRIYISDLAVDALARGRGIGRELMNRVISWARVNGASKLGWDVWRFNTLAKHFYERIGGHVDEEALPYLLELSEVRP